MDTVIEIKSYDIWDLTDSPRKRRSVFKSQDIRVVLRSMDGRLIDTQAQALAQLARDHECDVKGPVPFPVRKGNFFIKDRDISEGRERAFYRVKIHKRLIDIKKPTKQFISSLMMMPISKNININIEVKADKK